MKKKLPIKLILVLVFFLIVGWFFWDDIRRLPSAPSLRTLHWKTGTNVSDLQIRKVRNDESGFLIKPTKGRYGLPSDITDGAYYYEPASKEFRLVPQNFWDSAEGEIKTCPFDDPIANHQTYGWYPLIYETDAKGERAGVISAAGPRIPRLFSLLPGEGSGTGRILGMRYFEIFYSQTGKAKSKAVRIGDEEDINLCWTPDDNFVVIYDSYFINFSVVDIKALEEN